MWDSLHHILTRLHTTFNCILVTNTWWFWIFSTHFTLQSYSFYHFSTILKDFSIKFHYFFFTCDKKILKYFFATFSDNKIWTIHNGLLCGCHTWQFIKTYKTMSMRSLFVLELFVYWVIMFYTYRISVGLKI